LINFTWRVNREDARGVNIFEGGFLGLGNIGPFDRSVMLPGEVLEQSDGTAWMAKFCLNMLEMALLLASRNSVYEDVGIKFFEHFALIAAAMGRAGWIFLRPPAHEGRLLDHGAGVRWWAFCQSSPQRSWTPRYGSDCVCFANGPSGTLSISCGRKTISTTSPSAAGRSDLARREVPLPAHSGSYARRERVSIALRVEIALALPPGTPLVLDFDGRTCRLGYEPGESHSNLFGGSSNWR
jgi:hypothetical protein